MPIRVSKTHSLFMGILIVLLTVSLSATAKGPEASWAALKQNKFTALNSETKNQSPTQFANTQPVKVVVYWASWCSYCKRLLYKSTHFKKRSQYKNKVSFLGVSVEKSLKKAQAFAQKEKIKVPLWFDSDHKLKEGLGIPALPLTVVLGQKNEVLGIYSGLEDETFSNINQRIYRYLTYETADAKN